MSGWLGAQALGLSWLMHLRLAAAGVACDQPTRWVVMDVRNLNAGVGLSLRCCQNCTPPGFVVGRLAVGGYELPPDDDDDEISPTCDRC